MCIYISLSLSIYIYIYIYIYVCTYTCWLTLHSLDAAVELLASTPNLPTNIIPTKIAWLKLSGKLPMDMNIPLLWTDIMFESNPLKSTMLAGRSAASLDAHHSASVLTHLLELLTAGRSALDTDNHSNNNTSSNSNTNTNSHTTNDNEQR